MIVKILSSSATFSGVIYNTDKIDRDKGELMLVKNFGSLQGLNSLRPEDYRNYLKMLSAQNSRVQKPQFHAAISAKGKSYDKTALTEIAKAWLREMGYGDQPYLVVFHKDTDNHHVHIVTTRVDKKGKKISNVFENVRAIQNLNKVMGIDEKYSAEVQIIKAMGYSFSTKAQFLMILESQGYKIKEAGQHLQIIKFGHQLFQISLDKVIAKAETFAKNQQRQKRLKAFFEKYSAVYRTTLSRMSEPLPGGRDKPTGAFTSDFARFMAAEFGLTFLFHAQSDKDPYGYSIIDHAGKAVWKGSDIMPLKVLLAKPGREAYSVGELASAEAKFRKATPDEKAYYAVLLKASIRNYPDVAQGLRHQGLSLEQKDGVVLLTDPAVAIAIPVNDLLTDTASPEYMQVQQYILTTDHIDVPPMYIAPDVDDEAINGRNRRRKKKARTTTR
ncbi:relaxase/mobilization nuclease domain-containing protein [Mucilaginibacter sp. UYCu711]|uniref:relaxase/mobilization nuclease domain-containing protein n=1 Tax=Mucilaginibacter sp. UYCu711 TaxID=3156339 RepID=UPI003D25F381